jgi:Domain of unknown function (DUF4169)
MGEVVSFRKARKRVEQRQNLLRATENRLRHGRSKAKREFERAHEAKVRRGLDQHRIEAGDER